MKKYDVEDWVIFENEEFLILNKPPHIACLEDRTSPVNILERLKYEREHAQLCHRLDKETSGVLLVAKTPEMYRAASMQFEHREIAKVYHAVVDGVHNLEKYIEVNLPLYINNKGKGRVDYRQGKDSLTYFCTLEAYKLNTLVECRPVTGRTHQIRIHLAALEAPITGDELYGGRFIYLSQIKRRYNLKKGEEETPIMSRFALHARSIQFKDTSGKEWEFEADYPKDMKILLKQLSKFN